MPSSFLRPHASPWQLRAAYLVATLGSLAIAAALLPFREGQSHTLVAFLFLPFPILLALERADPGGFGGREPLTDRGIALLVRVEDVERRLEMLAIERTKGNQTRAAALLGLHRDQIRYRIEKFGLKID